MWRLGGASYGAMRGRLAAKPLVITGGMHGQAGAWIREMLASGGHNGNNGMATGPNQVPGRSRRWTAPRSCCWRRHLWPAMGLLFSPYASLASIDGGGGGPWLLRPVAPVCC